MRGLEFEDIIWTQHTRFWWVLKLQQFVS